MMPADRRSRPANRRQATRLKAAPRDAHDCSRQCWNG